MGRGQATTLKLEALSPGQPRSPWAVRRENAGIHSAAVPGKGPINTEHWLRSGSQGRLHAGGRDSAGEPLL